MENEGTPQYQLIITNRENLKVNGVLEVNSFDENEIVATTKLGTLIIKGEALHIIQLSLEEGKMILEGIIHSLNYSEDKKGKMKARSKGIMDRLFK